MNIAIVQSRITGKWGYCPEEARALLKPEYCEDATADTAKDAISQALNDPAIAEARGVPGILFKTYPVEGKS